MLKIAKLLHMHIARGKLACTYAALSLQALHQPPSICRWCRQPGLRSRSLTASTGCLYCKCCACMSHIHSLAPAVWTPELGRGVLHVLLPASACDWP